MIEILGIIAIVLSPKLIFGFVVFIVLKIIYEVTREYKVETNRIKHNRFH